MISKEKLLDIICTEAIEYGGLQEVPDRVDGTIEYYHSEKRVARGAYENGESRTEKDLQPIQYNLELVRMKDGTLKWEE